MEDLPIGKFSVGISSAHHNHDYGDDDHDDDGGDIVHKFQFQTM